jgi:RNA polymerase sigma-70 factor (ECF subfamily)
VDQRGLVERAKRGDRDAFARLVELAAPRLLGAARLIVRDPELAHDATQDALIRVWRDLPGLRDTDRFDAWTHRITVNACLDQLRRRRRRPIEVHIDDVSIVGAADGSAALEDRAVLDRALDRLAPDARAVVVLHYYVGLPISEVAVILGIPGGTAKSRLNRSLTAMRTAIDGPRADAQPAREGQPA